MFQELNQNKMMAQARGQGKTYSPLVQILIFFAIVIVINIITSVLLFPALFYLFYSNETLAALLNAGTIDYSAVNEQALNIMNSLPEWIVIYSLFLSAVMIAVPIIYCKFIEKRPVSTMGYRKAAVFKESAGGLAIGLIMAAGVALLYIACDAVSYSGTSAVNYTSLILSFLGYLIKGFAIETLIHGYFMVSLSKNTNLYYALISSSLVLSVTFTSGVQFTWTSYINTFILGLITGIYFIKRGNIWGAGMIYAVWNFVNDVVLNFSGAEGTACGLKFTAAEGFEKLSGGTLGAQSGLIATLVLFLGLGAVLTMRQNRAEEAIETQTDSKE